MIVVVVVAAIWAVVSVFLALVVGAMLRAGGRREIYDITLDRWDDAFEADVSTPGGTQPGQVSRVGSPR